MIFETLDTHGLKSAEADVQGNLGGFDSALVQARKDPGVKCNPAVGAATEPRSCA